ncbi:MAG: SbcC/MukB-like Walker B domain-containing protein, partial [bacterium]
LESRFRALERAIASEINDCTKRSGELEKALERSFTDFKTRWPLEASDMDATAASAPDFLARLHRLETDGLPTHEHRFFELLQNQSHQNLAALSKTLLLAHRTIIERMEEVNRSLSYAHFNPGTFLKIDVSDRQIEEVRHFKQEIEQALRHAWTEAREAAEARFKILRDLVDRLGSQEPEKRAWREAMLDVREHVEFVAREVDGDGRDLEIYRSGAGKSGGQRQKLATTCLAAALRYQLSSEEHDTPLYAPVVLDEAFEKADNEFTTLAMNIFVQFGFQMIVATPLKAVMTLEPFIGGACFVEIRDRRHSAVLMIEYDEPGHRLRLPEHIKETAELGAS